MFTNMNGAYWKNSANKEAYMFWKLFSGSVLMGLTLIVSAVMPRDLLKTYEAQSGKDSLARGACHIDAAKSVFSENNIRIPVK
jgi:hypothetical protein